MEFCFSVMQLIIAFFSVVVAIAALIYSILSYNKVNQINRNQIRREENQYLLTSIVTIYNLLETDTMLIFQKDFDIGFNKIDIDKKAFFEISKAKSYAISSENSRLFNYLDGLLSGESSEKMGDLIEEYFNKRDKLFKLKKRKNSDYEIFRDYFLPKIRDLRNNTLNKIDCFLKHI